MGLWVVIRDYCMLQRTNHDTTWRTLKGIMAIRTTCSSLIAAIGLLPATGMNVSTKTPLLSNETFARLVKWRSRPALAVSMRTGARKYQAAGIIQIRLTWNIDRGTHRACYDSRYRHAPLLIGRLPLDSARRSSMRRAISSRDEKNGSLVLIPWWNTWPMYKRWQKGTACDDLVFLLTGIGAKGASKPSSHLAQCLYPSCTSASA